MTDIASSPSALPPLALARRVPAASFPTLLVVVATVGGAGAIALATLVREPNGYEGHLALLLRFMAALKALTALGAFALLRWRFRAPITAGTALGYLAAFAPMTVAPGLIWSLAHVTMGALCFHAGLVAMLALALRDDGVGSRLPGRRH